VLSRNARNNTPLNMQVLLRNTQTGLFYAGPDAWTEQHAEAITFEGPDGALDAVCDKKLKSVEVILHFGDPLYDVPIQIAGLGR
jgi:hypothetical protein